MQSFSFRSTRASCSTTTVTASRTKPPCAARFCAAILRRRRGRAQPVAGACLESARVSSRLGGALRIERGARLGGTLSGPRGKTAAAVSSARVAAVRRYYGPRIRQVVGRYDSHPRKAGGCAEAETIGSTSSRADSDLLRPGRAGLQACVARSLLCPVASARGHGLKPRKPFGCVWTRR